MNEPDELYLSSNSALPKLRSKPTATNSKKLGLRDLVLTQILFIVGLPWVGSQRN